MSRLLIREAPDVPLPCSNLRDRIEYDQHLVLRVPSLSAYRFTLIHHEDTKVKTKIGITLYIVSGDDIYRDDIKSFHTLYWRRTVPLVSASRPKVGLSDPFFTRD